MAIAGVRADEIDRVFLTGGSSFVPAVRNILADRFGTDRMTGGSELTSVATGLALRAAELWPARPDCYFPNSPRSTASPFDAAQGDPEP
jgi:molecular chaperone DnaK (HSP70)